MAHNTFITRDKCRRDKSVRNVCYGILKYFNAASKTGNFGLNASFNIEILINLIQI